MAENAYLIIKRNENLPYVIHFRVFRIVLLSFGGSNLEPFNSIGVLVVDFEVELFRKVHDMSLGLSHPLSWRIRELEFLILEKLQVQLKIIIKISI